MHNFKDRYFSYIERRFKNSELNEAILYALKTGGKFFRPSIFQSLCKDIGVVDEEKIFWFSCFLEFHHNYTLIHDDLPCMDNDDYRRGKETVHKKFNEWIAVLAGDALLSASYECLSRVENFELSKFCFWALGEKGLIEGQAQDLQQEQANCLNKTLRTHELKTARLIQTALIGAVYLKEDYTFDLYKNIFRLGQKLGLLFQIKDDLDDFNSHTSEELNIVKCGKEELSKLYASLEQSQNRILKVYKLDLTRKVLSY